MDSKLSEEFGVNVGMHQGYVLSPFIFTVMVDVVSEFGKYSAISVFLCPDYLVLMSEMIEGFSNKFIKWN